VKGRMCHWVGPWHTPKEGAHYLALWPGTTPRRGAGKPGRRDGRRRARARDVADAGAAGGTSGTRRAGIHPP